MVGKALTLSNLMPWHNIVQTFCDGKLLLSSDYRPGRKELLVQYAPDKYDTVGQSSDPELTANKFVRDRVRKLLVKRENERERLLERLQIVEEELRIYKQYEAENP